MSRPQHPMRLIIHIFCIQRTRTWSSFSFRLQHCCFFLSEFRLFRRARLGAGCEAWSSILLVVDFRAMGLSSMSMTEYRLCHGRGGYIDVAAVLVFSIRHLCLLFLPLSKPKIYNCRSVTDTSRREKDMKNRMGNTSLLRSSPFTIKHSPS